MVKTTSTRKTADAAPEVTTEVDLKIDTPDVPTADYPTRWAQVPCECGTTVISDDPAELGTTITHANHLARLGQAAPPAEHVWQDEKGATAAKVTPKDGKVTVSLEQFEELATAAGLTKVDPVA